MGNAPTLTVRKPTCTSPNRDRTPTDAREVLAPTRRRARIQEVLRAAGQVEPDQVGAEQAFDDLGAPRHLHEQLDRRERDVQEESDGQIGPQHPQHLRHQLQLVVLHPHRRALGGRARGGLGEAPVDVDVAVPPLAVVDRLDDDVVVERPQRGVGEALVVLGDVLGGQPHRAQLEVVLDDGIFVAVRDARPADPGALAAAQERLERGDQAARAALPRVVPSGSRSMSIGSRLATTTKSEPLDTGFLC